MKKWILILICLFPIAAWAECENPIGQVYTADGITVQFNAGYGPESICWITTDAGTVYIPYTWDSQACQATLQTDPAWYLTFQDGSFDMRNLPRFVLVE